MSRIKMGNRKIQSAAFFVVGGILLLSFQNCGNPVDFISPTSKGNDALSGTPGIPDSEDLEVCESVSCVLTPLTDAPAVTTILIALGDEADAQLVVKGASAQLIAEAAVRYSTPKPDPKILLVSDFANGNESPEDTIYVRDVLLSRYNVTFLQGGSSGLKDSDLEGYDLVWYNNPGHSMGTVAARDALLRFAGGVVLQGDDLTQGRGFNLQELTGLKYVDNGAQVVCGGVRYNHDNNFGEKYRVRLDPDRIPGASSDTIEFLYGNDIDNSIVVREDLEVIATATGGPLTCTEERPAIVRYIR